MLKQERMWRHLIKDVQMPTSTRQDAQHRQSSEKCKRNRRDILFPRPRQCPTIKTVTTPSAWAGICCHPALLDHRWACEKTPPFWKTWVFYTHGHIITIWSGKCALQYSPKRNKTIPPGKDVSVNIRSNFCPWQSKHCSGQFGVSILCNITSQNKCGKEQCIHNTWRNRRNIKLRERPQT